MVRCELCGEELHHVTHSHLFYTHGLRVSEYRSMFPSAELVSEEFKDIVSSYTSSRFQSEDTKALRSRNMLESWQDPIFRDKMVESQQGRIFSYEHRKHISEAAIERGKDPEYCKKVSESVRALWENPEYVAQQQASRHLKPNFDETWLMCILNAYFPGAWTYNGNGNVTIGGRIPDYVHQDGIRKVIELFGSYWHTMDDEPDRISHYSKYRYDCLVLWTDEIYDVESVESRVRELIERKVLQGRSS